MAETGKSLEEAAKAAAEIAQKTIEEVRETKRRVEPIAKRKLDPETDEPLSEELGNIPVDKRSESKVWKRRKKKRGRG